MTTEPPTTEPPTIVPPTIADVETAAERIAAATHRTPVARCASLDAMTGLSLYFKCEHLQRGGAFKLRGALNATTQLVRDAAGPAGTETATSTSVVTHSSGNHAQALALAARALGLTARVVMPRNASRVKLEAVRGYGAEVTLCEPTLDARDAAASALLEAHGGVFVPPYDHPLIIAGQGTVALELCAQVPELDAIVAPVGGGGLLSGVCIAAHARAPRLRIFAAEPAGADDCARSLHAGRLIPQTGPDTIADGLLTSLGEHTWPIIRDHVADVLLASDEAIIAAMRLLWTRAKLLVEPSAAVALAVVLGPAFVARAEREGLRHVGVVLSGGNVDLDALPW